MQSATVAAPTAETAASLAWDDDLVGPSPETLMALAGLTRVREGLKEPRPTVDSEIAATDTAPAEPPQSLSPLPQPQPQLPPQLSEDEIIRALAAATAVDADADADEGPAPDMHTTLGAHSIEPLLVVPPMAPVTVAAPALIEADERPPMIIEKAQAEFYGMEAPIQPIRFRALNPMPGFAMGVTLSVAAGALLFLALAPA